MMIAVGRSAVVAGVVGVLALASPANAQAPDGGALAVTAEGGCDTVTLTLINTTTAKVTFEYRIDGDVATAVTVDRRITVDGADNPAYNQGGVETVMVVFTPGSGSHTVAFRIAHGGAEGWYDPADWGVHTVECGQPGDLVVAAPDHGAAPAGIGGGPGRGGVTTVARGVPVWLLCLMLAAVYAGTTLWRGTARRPPAGRRREAVGR